MEDATVSGQDHGPAPAEPFVWSVVVAEPAAARAALRQLTTRLLAACPGVVAALCPASEGVSLLDFRGDALDLEAVPCDLLEEVRAFFGPGLYPLPVPRQVAVRVERAWQPKPASAGRRDRPSSGS